MTAKEYLSKIQTYKNASASITRRIEELYAQAEGIKAIVYDKDRVQVSPANRMEEVFAEIDAEAEKLAKALVRYRKAVQVRTEQIAEMEKRDEARVLLLRYVDGKRWEEVACEMNYSFRHVIRMHGSALRSFAELHKDVLLCPTDR